MFADPSKLNHALDAAQKRVLAFGKMFGKVGLGAAAAGGAAFAPIAKMFSAAVTEGADVANMANKFGSTAEEISRLKGAFAQAGVGAGDFSGAMETLAAKVSEATSANGFLLEDLQSLGSGRDFMGKGIDEQFDMIAERIKAIPNAIDKMRAANELGMGSMILVLKKGKAGLDELRAAAVANGKQMSSSDAAASLQIWQSYNDVMEGVRGTLLEVGKALLPTGASFKSVGENLRDGLSAARDWIADHKEIVIAATAATGAMILTGAAISGIGAAAMITIPILTALKVSIGLVYAILAPFTGTVGIAVAAFTLLGAGAFALGAYLASDGKIIEELGEAFGEAAEFIKSSWKGVTDAISAGNFALAFDIGLKSAEVVWRGFVLLLTTTWIGFKAVFVDTWQDATTFIAKAFVLVIAGIEVVFNELIRAMISAWNGLAGALKLPKISAGGLATQDEIGRDAAAKIKAIEDEAAAEKRRRDAFRYGQYKDDKDALDIAKEELELLKQQAAEEAKRAEQKPGGGKLENIPEPKTPPSFAAISESAKGTLGSSSIQQALGYGDNVGQRQLDAQIGIQTATQRTAVAVEKIAEKPASKFG